MKDHEGALVKALVAHLGGDGALQALLGDPVRVWDEAPQGAGFPHLVIGRCESRPLNADGGGVEQRLTLTCASQFRGLEEARAVAAAVRARLADAPLEADGPPTACTCAADHPLPATLCRPPSADLPLRPALCDACRDH